MIINKKIRIIVCKQIIKKLERELEICNPFGYTDCQLIYDNLIYWEDILETYINK